MVGAVSEKSGLLREIVLAAIVFVFLVPVALGQGGAPVTLDRIIKAWQARQDRVKSARISWKERRTEPKGSISSSMPRIVRRRLQLEDDAIIPPTDTTVEFAVSIHFHEAKVRYAYEGQEWSDNIKGYRNIKYTSVFDGVEAKDLHPEGVGYATWPIGVIRDGSTYRDAQMFRVRPVLFTFRPLVPEIRPFDIGSMTVTTGRVMIDGRSCVELERRAPGTGTSVFLWLDPARDFVIVRQRIIERVQTVNQINIQYRADTASGWTPSGWTIVNHIASGHLYDAAECTVTDSEFNVEVDPSLFTLSFPPGSRVQDQKRKEDWVIKLNGEKRPLVREDRGATHDQIINSNPGEALGAKKKTFFLTLPGLVLLSIALLAIGLFTWRRTPWCRKMLRLSLF
ncbi:MAG: LolA-like protein [Gemmataceae bacterium]